MPATSTLVADTSVVYAALDLRDDDHAACAELLRSGRAVLVPAPLIAEIDWLGRARGLRDAGMLVLDSVLDGSLVAVDLDIEDWARVRQLIDRYADLPLDVFDASVVATAERLEAPAIATLDHRHFSVVEPRHVRRFELLP